jgi:seryl-tRNA synthetase
VDTTSPFQDRHPNAAEPTSPHGDDLPGGNIDKVRDILFGGQMRDYERRFARLEERLVQETTELRDEVRRRLGALELFVKQEAESLANRIHAEHDSRSDAVKGLAEDARHSSEAFEKRTGQLDDTIARAQRELRQQILELHQLMSDDVRQKVDDVIGRLNRASTDLRHDKTDRATLAALLTEMAMRLTNELSIPGLDKERHG